jgi:hypothetical protein
MSGILIWVRLDKSCPLPAQARNLLSVYMTLTMQIHFLFFSFCPFLVLHPSTVLPLQIWFVTWYHHINPDNYLRKLLM